MPPLPGFIPIPLFELIGEAASSREDVPTLRATACGSLTASRTSAGTTYKTLDGRRTTDHQPPTSIGASLGWVNFEMLGH